MSNIPTGSSPRSGPEEAFNFILKGIIQSTQSYREAKIKPILLSFISHPAIKNLLSQSETPAPPQDTSNNVDLQKIQDTLSSLTRAVESLKKGSPPPQKSQTLKQKGATNTPSPLRTYSAAAGSRPPNPSLVVDLAKSGLDKDSRVKPEKLCQAINLGLATVTPPQVQLAAVRWTAKGNLVITGGPAATPHSLQIAAPHISVLIPSILPSKLPHLPQPRANVKWSKLLLNGVPTGASDDRAPYSPDECHRALASTNPSYSSLRVTQEPNWVRPPTSYSPGAISSLSVAFEDPDGSLLKALLADKYLYAFGTRILVKKWKYRPNSPKDKSKQQVGQHPHTSDAHTHDEEDVDTALQDQPPLFVATTTSSSNMSQQPAATPTDRPRTNPPRHKSKTKKT